ncbi:aminotransferase class I/II-fold pyridoxal phosphate-dependent enzyme [Phaeobacter sp. B1627]|uniref:aminotransferase class I/II-fold pyridoxal phosphate-dependent enzyme n=1 Tax=Phaeobacter sp. B1627 TaxID=2583809 RepID=UPI00159EE6FA|nr:aminotransferase class I/II-fold pyridoxal phosphate-dependent enzyme [Phaeobacter sp. B1627]
MEDIAQTLHTADQGNGNFVNLGIGNPAPIPEVTTYWRSLTQEVIDENATCKMGSYGASRGEEALLLEIARFFRTHLDWDIGPENIVVGPGSQFLCFAAGVLFADCDHPIILPRLPDYTGYDALRAGRNALRGIEPQVEILDQRSFRYRLDESALAKIDRAGLFVASTPSNPVSDVLDQRALLLILDAAKRTNATVLLDHAYGLPFPAIAHGTTWMTLDPRVLHCFSLSKAGLPGARLGFAIGDPDRIDAMTAFVSNTVLHASRLSQDIATAALRDQSILALVRNNISPHYRRAAVHAQRAARDCLPASINWKTHAQDGGMFLWLWCDEPWSDDLELYRMGKERGVFFTPGRYFFLGSEQEHAWMKQCLRISLNQPAETLEHGLTILADCMRALRDSAPRPAWDRPLSRTADRGVHDA